MATSSKRKDSTSAPDAGDSVPEKRTPVRTLREGDCSLSIWRRVYMAKGKETVFYSWTPERSYRDKSGKWNYTKSFSPEDGARIVTLLQQMELTVAELRREDGTAQ